MIAFGPSNETQLDANFSYGIYINESLTKLTFGVKAGAHLLYADWSKGKFQYPDNVYQENLNLLSLGQGFICIMILGI